MINGNRTWTLVLFSCMLLGTACPSCRDDDDDDTSCTPGNEGCGCDNGACGAGLSCLDGTCRPNVCAPGELGCSCTADRRCGTSDGGVSLVCENNICRLPGCRAGTEGCPCTASGRCGISANASPLTCANGTCVLETCPVGQTGCTCTVDGTCTSSSDVCRDGFCQASTCTPGMLNCECVAGSCAGNTLTCLEGRICVDATGYLGGPCFQNNTCHPGMRCQGEVCMPCNPGSRDCTCAEDGGCNQGLACTSRHVCGVPGEGAAPSDMKCYTPCQSSLRVDGGFRACPADNLMPGCVDPLTCVLGSCVAAGAQPPTCAADHDCPDFQTCIDNHCYSNCEGDSDCPAGRDCYRHVCRTPCSSTEDSCPEGWFCSMGTSDLGWCMPLVESGNDGQREVAGSFTLSTSLLEFSNIRSTATFRVRNDSEGFQSFTVRKRSHTRYLDDGSAEQLDDPDDAVTCNPTQDCPLTWLELAEGSQRLQSSSILVGVEGGGAETVITIARAGETNAPRWQGTLEVSHPRFGTQVIRLAFAERPEGQWKGTMYYFAAFGDANLAQWSATPQTRGSDSLLDQVGNAFVQHWGAFRQGRISWDKLLAMMVATRSESWKWPTVQSLCDPQRTGKLACYLYDSGASGIAPYSPNTDSFPVPTGVTEMPLALNLRIPDPNGHPDTMEGRIESSESLQYAGYPKFTLRFANNPSQCSLEAFDACVTFVDEFSADIYVGGRYLTSATDTECQAHRPDGSYVQVATPWLLPGFKSNTYLDGATKARYRHECRDTRLPSWTSNTAQNEALKTLNAMMAGANPVPDGRTRKRELRLIDGALVNQKQLVLLFEERFASFLDPVNDQAFTAYGYVMLERARTDVDPTDQDANQVPDAFQGSTPSDDRNPPSNVLAPTCSAELIAAAMPGETTVTADNVDTLTLRLIHGNDPSLPSQVLDADDVEQVHYLCVDTGLFDGGETNRTKHGVSSVMPNNNSCTVEGDGGSQSRASNHMCEDGLQGSVTGTTSVFDGGQHARQPLCAPGTDFSDCGTRYDDDLDQRQDCPVGSQVVFFTVNQAVMPQEKIASQACQRDGTCAATLESWRTDGTVLQFQPRWRCTIQAPPGVDAGSAREVYCDNNRLDLRDGKEFYSRTDSSAAFLSMGAAVDSAFRYRTRFASRTGSTVGFAPQLCEPGSPIMPYCYDAEAIEELRGRVDCLLDIWSRFYQDLDAGDQSSPRGALDSYLATNFAFLERRLPDNTVEVRDGFERLNAELLIMLGDEAYTAAFASRFDLAGVRSISFEGSRFEPDGINLTGVAGYELYNLYSAVQYYQEVLDQFYRMSPLVKRALEYGSTGRNFVSLKTVVRYFDKLIRASTQKSKALSEIAVRYQGFNRPDLARRVIERAFTATYLESIVMSRLMMGVVQISAPQDRAQVLQVVEDSQRRYRTAATEMRRVYRSISDGASYFGFSPDYVPLPALDWNQPNAFELVVARAQERVRMARDREDAALNSNRSYNTDAAQFQAELARIRQTYDNQLGELCGTFVAVSDGRVYPAIEKYAELDHRIRGTGDPCGLVGAGKIHDSMAHMEEMEMDIKKILLQYSNLFQEIEIERQRVSDQCGIIISIADYVYNQAGQVKDLRNAIAASRMVISAADRTISLASTLAGLSKSEGPGGAISGAISSTVFGITFGIAAGLALGAEAGIVAMESEIAQIEREGGKWQTLQQCAQAQVESNARTSTLLLQTKHLDLDLLRAQHRVALAASEIERLYNEAKRIQLERRDSEQMAINVEAARNDPNVRIYKNDAVINADFSFDDALRETYRATKVFEYYTSQSYPDTGKLFLIRMVARGDYNLENYLVELQNAFSTFEEEYGNPDTRMQIVSLRDHVMQIPATDQAGMALSQSARIDAFRARLKDPSNLDQNGYLTFPFSTTLQQLSPLTSNHKVLYIEAEVIGADVGDTLGRVYVRQKGTGSVRTLLGERVFYRFPERAAVVNSFFNGQRLYVPELYKTYRLRDRPLVNTAWELVLNQRDELVNKDINLDSLTDVRLYVYYTDFTNF